MHKLCTLYFLLSTLILPAQNNENWRVLPIRSQQEFEQGAFGGEGEQHPHSIARCLNHPDYIYLSHDVGGAWRSSDAGETWHKCLDKGLYLPFGQSIQVDPNDPNLVFLTVDNSYNYLAQEFEGVYRSTDGGENWQHVLSTDVNFNSGQHRIYRHNIEYDLTSEKRWYAAFPKNGLYRSDDSGLTWKKTSSLADHATIYGVYCHPSDSSTLFVASINGFYTSTNRGENLQKSGDLPSGPVSSIAVHPQHPDRIYATVRNDGLYRSVDGGSHFEQIKAHPVSKVVMNPGFPNKLYLIGLSQNSIVSNDGGATWSTFGPTTTFPGLGRENGWRRWIDGDLSGLVANSQNETEAVAFSRSTLFKTTTGGTDFQESATGFTGNAWSWWNGAAAFDRLNADRFAFFNNDVGMKITLTGGNYFEPNTNPNAWSWYQSGLIEWLGAYSGDFQPKAGSKTIVASVGNYFKTQLMRTTNNGKSWTLVTGGSNQEDMNLFIAFHPDDPNTVYAGNKFSTDAGKTFKPFDFPSGYSGCTLVGMCNSYPNFIFAMDGERRTILHSEDRGTTWDIFVKPGWRFNRLDGLPTFAADPFDPDKIYTLDSNYDLAMYDGNNWTTLNVLELANGHSSSNFVRTVTVDPNVPGILYAGMFENGIPCIFRSLDGGDSWQDISENLPRNGMSAMKVNPHTGELYKGSCIGTWIYPAPYEVNVGKRSTIPKNFKLGTAYPNPFNPEITIPYSLTQSEHVSLSISNVLGQTVHVLVDDILPAGQYKTQWNGIGQSGDNIAGGIYFLHMKIKDSCLFQKITFLP